jgi:hypothetical protein
MDLPEPTEFAWLADLQKCRSFLAQLGPSLPRDSNLFVVAQSFTTCLADHPAKTTDFGCEGYSKAYFHTNLLFSSVGAQSPGAVLGAGMIPLSLCLRNLVLRLLSSPQKQESHMLIR